MLLFYLPSFIISVATPNVIQTHIIQSSTHPHILPFTSQNLQPTLTQRTSYNSQPTTNSLLNSHQSIHIKIIIGFKVFIINIH